MSKVKQTADELEAHLQEQIGFLRRSAESFDGGDDAEHKRLAHTLRVLLHQTKASHAVLDQVDVLSRMKFWDTATPIIPGNLLTASNLTAMYISTDGTAGYAAHLSMWGQGQWTGFEEWWSNMVMNDDYRETFSRRDLVLAVANTDGGSHVDPVLKEAYARLSRSNSLGWLHKNEESEAALGSPVPAAIRQIAYEVEVSLYEEFPAIAPDGPIDLSASR